MHDRRRAPRRPGEWRCSLQRPAGGPIPARAVNLGPTGMCVLTVRPLSQDEVLDFELTEEHISGKVRVMRQEGHATYGLRFESLPEAALNELTDMCA